MAVMVLAGGLIIIGCGSSSGGSDPLPADFSGTYTTSVENMSVSKVNVAQAEPPDGELEITGVTGKVSGYTFVSGSIEGRGENSARLIMTFTNNSTGETVTVEWNLTIDEKGNVSVSGTWKEGGQTCPCTASRPPTNTPPSTTVSNSNNSQGNTTTVAYYIERREGYDPGLLLNGYEILPDGRVLKPDGTYVLV